MARTSWSTSTARSCSERLPHPPRSVRLASRRSLCARQCSRVGAPALHRCSGRADKLRVVRLRLGRRRRRPRPSDSIYCTHPPDGVRARSWCHQWSWVGTQPLVLGVSGGGLAEVGPRQSLCRLTRPQSALRGWGDNRGTDWFVSRLCAGAGLVAVSQTFVLRGRLTGAILPCAVQPAVVLSRCGLPCFLQGSAALMAT